jgi:predicted P-loop ATPase
MITRFASLFDTTCRPDPIGWEDLFEEFMTPTTFLGDRNHAGWSAGEFDPATRALANVKRVHAMVLDYDNKDPKTGEMVEQPVLVDHAAELWADFYGLIHTSRNHTATWQRFRVILPYARPISPFEHSALWYRVNAHVGGKLDPAPKDPSRFWYTPGVANIDGACFEARRLTGGIFDPDEWLKKPDPTLSGQPLNGATPINASVRETRARAYLSKMPEAISGQQGHNALWSAARKLVADFGLEADMAYRLLATEYNPRCRPPWSEKELRHKVKQALRAAVRNPVAPDRPPRRQAAQREWTPERANAEHDTEPERAAAAGDDETPPPPAPKTEPPDPEWRRALRYNLRGALTKDPGNAAVTLRNHDDWRGCFEYNSFSDQVHWARRPPDIGFVRPEAGERLQDHHAILVHHWFARVLGVSFTKSAVWDAVIDAARANTVHPVCEYLSSLVWDGTPRLSKWLVTYLGADATDYTFAVGRWWLISAIARAFQPGCQADHMLILEGAQGAGKSTAMGILGGEWYLGSLPDIRDRERAAAVLQGNWIIEIGELDAFRGAAATRVKDWLTQRFDEYRAAYARSTSRRFRGCVFVGTTNESTYLQDATGARRFWPVAVRRLDREALQRDRDQLWAETRLAYEAGESWWPTTQFAAELEEQQEQRYDDDEWQAKIAIWVKGGEFNLTPRDGFTLGEVLSGALGIETAKWDRSAQTRVGTCLKRLGFRWRFVSEAGMRARRFYAGAE